MPAACIVSPGWGRDGRPAIPPGLSEEQRRQAYLDARRRGYFLGRALVSAASSQPARVEGTNTGRLGRALCGYENPYRPLRPVVGGSLAVRVNNINESLDDGWQFTVEKIGGQYFEPFAISFTWDGSDLNDTTYGPWLVPPGTYRLSGIITQPNYSGNYFLITVRLNGDLIEDDDTFGDNAANSFTFTVPEPEAVAP